MVQIRASSWLKFEDSYDQHFGRPRHGFRGQLRISVLGVLAFKVTFDYPTGSRIRSSDIDRYLVSDDLRDRLAERVMNSKQCASILLATIEDIILTRSIRVSCA